MGYRVEDARINELVGMTFCEVSVNPEKTELTLVDANGKIWQFAHSQECCEDVQIEDICGNLSDLLNSRLISAYESCSESSPPEVGTWTFYNLATIRGSVTVRWYGLSNGHYSEKVSLYRLIPRGS